MLKLNRIVAQAGMQVYRDITAVCLYSVFSSLFLVPIALLLPLPAAVPLLAVVYVPVVAAVVYAVHCRLEGGSAVKGSLLRGLRMFYLRSVVYGLLLALFALILYAAWWYYGSREGHFSFVLSIFQTYFVAMFLISQTYTLPLMVQENLGVWKAVAGSIKLFFAKSGYTFAVFVQLLSVALLLGLTVVGFAFLFVGMYAVFVNMAAANLIRREEEQEA